MGSTPQRQCGRDSGQASTWISGDLTSRMDHPPSRRSVMCSVRIDVGHARLLVGCDPSTCPQGCSALELSCSWGLRSCSSVILVRRCWRALAVLSAKMSCRAGSVPVASSNCHREVPRSDRPDPGDDEELLADGRGAPGSVMAASWPIVHGHRSLLDEGEVAHPVGFHQLQVVPAGREHFGIKSKHGLVHGVAAVHHGLSPQVDDTKTER